jgi:hypothetical protein
VSDTAAIYTSCSYGPFQGGGVHKIGCVFSVIKIEVIGRVAARE